jgi:hypothetical protein
VIDIRDTALLRRMTAQRRKSNARHDFPTPGGSGTLAVWRRVRDFFLGLHDNENTRATGRAFVSDAGCRPI